MTAPRTADPDAARAPGRGGRGLEIVLIAVYAIFALSATARSLVQVLTKFEVAPVAFSLSLISAATYIAVTVALVRGGRRSLLARVLVVLELIGVLVVGVLTLLDPALFPEPTVWSVFGQGYGYVPLALPVLALVYMLIGDRRARRAREQDAGARTVLP